MKRVERDEARRLRKEGKSLSDIVKLLNVSKASVSEWVRDIKLTDKQRKGLNERGFSIDAIEKRRINRITNTKKKHQAIINEAKAEIDSLSKRELFLLGVALYWGEGGKTRGMARISNSDTRVIKAMMKFFREVCHVPEEKFRGHVHTFSHLNKEKAEKYWSTISRIPKKQFYKTYSKPSIASMGKKDSLPYGTFEIYVCDTNLYLKILGYIERLAELSA